MSQRLDYLVIGAGYAGLSAAALLARSGRSVQLVEHHATLGGCASFFRKKNFTFDVGATTLSGMLPHQPLGRLFEKLDIQPLVKKLSIGMVICLEDGTHVNRYADQEEWIAEAESVFGEFNQRKFWQVVSTLEKRIWDLTASTSRMPFSSLADIVSVVGNPVLLRSASLLPYLFRPFSSLLRSMKLESNQNFHRFLSEQLLISTQNTIDQTPIASAVMGLAYPEQTYYPYGGIYSPALEIAKRLKSDGGDINYRTTITSIRQDNNGYECRTAEGTTIHTRTILSSIPIWNMVHITDGAIRKYFARYAQKYPFAWGAVTLNIAVKNTFVIESAYYQIHLEEPLPWCASNSIFVTFSLEDDTQKAPEGWRTVTVSTHAHATEWNNLSTEDYNLRKETLSIIILRKIGKVIRGFTTHNSEYLSLGTPSTFEHYTLRWQGFVGGIPHSIATPLLSMPPNITPFRNFYMIGDSVFPGQGIPSVVLGALNVVETIIRRT